MADGVQPAGWARIVTCSHPDFPTSSRDFSELWTGFPDDKKAVGKGRWNGGARGRPQLADDLWSAIRDDLQHKPPDAHTSLLYMLRTFWRFLDGYERHGFSPIEQLTDIQPAMSLLWLTPVDGAWESCRDKKTHNKVGALLRIVRRRRFGAADVWDWHPFPARDRTLHKDLPTKSQSREALHLLKRRARAIFGRWARADAMAAQGRDLLELPRKSNGKLVTDIKPSEADAHATYRALIARTGNALPTPRDLRKELGLSDGADLNRPPNWWPRYDDSHPMAGQHVIFEHLQEGLYPSVDDIECLSQLFMARTGWNIATVLSLDISNPDWSRPYGDARTGLHVIESWKERSGAWQWTLSMAKTTTGPHYIVSTLLERTAPLRDRVRSGEGRCTTPAIALRSPWLSVGAAVYLGHILVRKPGQKGNSGRWWKQVVHEHNAAVAPERHIPASMTPSDWRDMFADYVFQDSRYSWVMVQWALGQKHMASARHYLRNLLWRRYSEKKLSEVVTVLIDNIQTHARVDVAIVRAKVEFDFTPTPEDRARLEAHRQEVHERDISYSGYKCTDRYFPPQQIDPGNPSDGTMACRRGDRCPGCPLGQAVDCTHMARRLAELRWLQHETNATVWFESQYASDLEGLQASLSQWPAEEVAAQVRHWEGEILAGRHKVIRFGGRS